MSTPNPMTTEMYDACKEAVEALDLAYSFCGEHRHRREPEAQEYLKARDKCQKAVAAYERMKLAGLGHCSVCSAELDVRMCRNCEMEELPLALKLETDEVKGFCTHPDGTVVRYGAYSGGAGGMPSHPGPRGNEKAYLATHYICPQCGETLWGEGIHTCTPKEATDEP